MGFDPLCTRPVSIRIGVPLLEPEPVLELEPEPVVEPAPVPEPALELVSVPVLGPALEEEPAPAVEPAPVAPVIPPDPQPVRTRLATRQNSTAIPRREARKRI